MGFQTMRSPGAPAGATTLTAAFAACGGGDSGEGKTLELGGLTAGAVG